MKFRPIINVVLTKVIDVDIKDTIPVPPTDPDNYLNVEVKDSVMKEYIKKELNIPDWEILGIEIK